MFITPLSMAVPARADVLSGDSGFDVPGYFYFSSSLDSSLEPGSSGLVYSAFYINVDVSDVPAYFVYDRVNSSILYSGGRIGLDGFELFYDGIVSRRYGSLNLEASFYYSDLFRSSFPDYDPLSTIFVFDFSLPEYATGDDTLDSSYTYVLNNYVEVFSFPDDASYIVPYSRNLFFDSFGVLSVFSGVGSWLSGAVQNISTMFWTAESGMTVLGYLAVASLAVAVILLILYLIAGWLKFR